MDNPGRILSEQILELRYKPNPKILDYRGTWAEIISELMGLKHWRISENRIDVFDDTKIEKFRVFVSFKNCGVIIRNDSEVSSLTKNYFPDQANKFLRFLLDQKAFSNPLFIHRIGIRTRFASRFDGSFVELLSRYTTRLFTLTQEAQQAINANLIDIGIPITLSKGNGKINANSGPMEKDQLDQSFGLFENLPDVSFYLDLDYWTSPQNEVDGKEVLKTVRSFADENWDMHERIKSLVFRNN